MKQSIVWHETNVYKGLITQVISNLKRKKRPITRNEDFLWVEIKL